MSSSITTERRAAAKPRRIASGAGRWRAAFYRQCRAWHAYLSAFAFLALIFFAATGLVLNHPEWIEGRAPPREARVIELSAAEGAVAARADDPAAVLAPILAARVPLRGAYTSGETLDGEVFLRFEGPSGASDVRVDLTNGRAEISTQRAGVLAFMNDLHRGKNAGAVWRAFIDAAALVLIGLSVIGYLLFFSLRFRLLPSLILTAASLAGMAGLIWVFVP